MQATSWPRAPPQYRCTGLGHTANMMAPLPGNGTIAREINIARERFGYAPFHWDELEHQGSVFGCATVTLNFWNSPANVRPSQCEECGGFKDHWVRYNYRCCISCWNVISSQLWSFLLDSVHDHPARVVWAFLLEPFQHGGVRRRFCLDRGWVRY